MYITTCALFPSKQLLENVVCILNPQTFEGFVRTLFSLFRFHYSACDNVASRNLDQCLEVKDALHPISVKFGLCTNMAN